MLADRFPPTKISARYVPATQLPAGSRFKVERKFIHPAEFKAGGPYTPGVLAGDMNMWGWSVDRLVPRGWRRAVKGRTYPSPRPHSQTDHILVNEGVEVVGGEVVRQAMSDHRPVRARLRV